MQYIENEFLKVGVDENGAELSSIYDKKNSREVLWHADKAYWGRHAPVLFPIVGKVNGGVYRYSGKEFKLGQHGFARDSVFTLVTLKEDEVVFILKSSDKTLELYPFSFELTVSHKLSGSTLVVSWKVVNTDTKEMYFSIGGHPAFNVPVSGLDAKKTDFYINVGKDQVSYKLLDEKEGTVLPDLHTLKTENGYLRVDESLFDNDALIFDEYEVEKAQLCYPDKTPYVTLDAKGFPAYGIWSVPKKNCPFICLEPWIGRADDKGFNGELKDKYKEQSLKAGSEFNASYTITING
ncbi:MAG: aldose 1-epimerase family protein [Succinivibrio sp.]